MTPDSVIIPPSRRAAPLIVTDNRGEVVKAPRRRSRQPAPTTDNAPPSSLTPGSLFGDYGWPKSWDEHPAVDAYTSTVYTAADAIANRVARLVQSNWLAAIRPDGSEVDIKVHPILDVLRQPSPLHTGTSLFKLTSLWLDLTGNAYWLIIRDGFGAVRGLWPLMPQFTIVVVDDERFISGVNYYPEGLGSEPVGFPIEDVIHFRLENPSDYIYGWSTLRAAAYEKNTADAIRVYESNWFKNQARPDYVIAAGIPPGPNAQDDLERLWARIKIHHQGAKRFGLPLLLPKDSEVKHLQFSLADMQFLQLAGMTESQILSIFKVPEFAVAKGQPFTTRASAVQASKEFAENAIEPRASLIWDTLNARLINEPRNIPRPPGVRLELRHRSAAPDDEDLQLDKATRLFKGFLVTRNEARGLVKLPPAKMGGDEYAPVVEARLTPKPNTPLAENTPNADANVTGKPIPQPPAKSFTPPPAVAAPDLTTKAAQDAYFAKAIAPQDSQTARATRAIRSFFGAQRDRVIPEVRAYVALVGEKMAGWSSVKVRRTMSEWIRKADSQADTFDRKKEEAALAALLLSLVRRAAQDGGDQFAEALDVEWSVARLPEVAAWVQEHADDQASFVTRTTARQIAETVREGVAAGHSPEQVADDVDALFDSWTTPSADGGEGWRSALIARTVIGSSFGYAHLEVLRRAWRQGKVKSKLWIDSGDERVRDGSRGEANHRIGGEKAAIPARFSNGMLCPGDTTTGNPSDYMGERCVLGYEAS